MAQLNDTMVQGDLRVTSLIHGDVGSRMLDANTTSAEMTSWANKFLISPLANTVFKQPLVSPLVPAPTAALLRPSLFCPSNGQSYFDTWYGNYHIEAYYYPGTGEWNTQLTPFLTADTASSTYMNQSGSNAVAPSGNGGNGATATLLNNLTGPNNLDEITSDNVLIPTTNSNGTDQTVWYKRPLSKLWPWIKGKLTSDSGVNISGNAATVNNYSPDKRTYIWGQAVGTTQVLDISIGSYSYDTTFMIMFSTSSTKWPSIIAVSCRYSNNAWESVPKASLIYNTSAGSDTAKPLIKQYLYDGRGHILVQPVVTRNSETQCTIIAASGDVAKLTVSAIADTNTLWTSASAITNIEQNVSKESVGSKIGDTDRPVYVAASGFVSTCDYAGSFKMSNGNGDTLLRRLSYKAEGWVDGSRVTLTLRVNETGTDANTIYFS